MQRVVSRQATERHREYKAKRPRSYDSAAGPLCYSGLQRSGLAPLQSRRVVCAITLLGQTLYALTGIEP